MDIVEDPKFVGRRLNDKFPSVHIGTGVEREEIRPSINQFILYIDVPRENSAAMPEILDELDQISRDVDLSGYSVFLRVLVFEETNGPL